MAQDPYKYFRVEARELVDQLGQGLLDLEREGGGDNVSRLLRLAHTLKGAARVVRQPEIADHAHAIEDALTPYRELAGVLPRQHVDSVLKLLDAITGRVAVLLPPQEQTAVAASKPQPEEAVRSVRADVEEIDELLDGIAETYSQLGNLRDAGGLADDALRLADLVVEELGAVAGRRDASAAETLRLGRAHAAGEELRGLLVRLERNLSSARERMGRELGEVRETAEQLRLVPASVLFTALERVARDAAQALGKQVAFEGRGGDVRVDAHVIRTIQEALLQVVRNAVAHGIEAGRDRLAAGKPPQGRVTMTVSRRGRRAVFRCEDDGRGIDLDALRRAAAQKGLALPESRGLDAGGLIRLMLKGGISTSPAITEVAGRGIGMDIVREAVERLRGEVTVKSDPGIGTAFELAVPLSISSVEALIVESGGVAVSLPLDAVRHTLRLDARDIYRTSLGDAIVYDGKATPFVALARLIGGAVPAQGRNGVSAIVVAGAGGVAAIGVDRLLGTSNIVFRSLPELAPAGVVVAGASLDAAGSPQLMLDPDGLVVEAMRQEAAAPEAVSAARPVLIIDDSLTTRMLEQSILESAGYEVDLATSAEEGLVRAKERSYALFLVDVEMPGMDGFSFVERIRADPQLRDIPAILVTSRNAPEDKRRGEAVGASGYVVKSEFDQAELLKRIRRLVS